MAPSRRAVVITRQRLLAGKTRLCRVIVVSDRQFLFFLLSSFFFLLFSSAELDSRFFTLLIRFFIRRFLRSFTYAQTRTKGDKDIQMRIEREDLARE